MFNIIMNNIEDHTGYRDFYKLYLYAFKYSTTSFSDFYVLIDYRITGKRVHVGLHLLSACNRPVFSRFPWL